MSSAGKSGRSRHAHWQRLLFVLVLVVGGCGSYLPPVPSIIKPVSEDEEVKISREFRREAKKHFKFITHPEVERYIDRIGQRILSAAGPQPFDYRFFVIENPELNAFAVPGGSIYLHSGLLERAQSTSEVAGVMSHEIVHVKGRHMARMSGLDGTALLGLLGTLLVAAGPGGQAAGAVGQAIAATRQIAYTRQLEMEADTLGVRYMSEAGYDPNGSLGFLKILDQERALNPIDIPPYMMTHPLSQERVANVELVIRSLGKRPRNSDEPDPIKKIQIILRSERYESERVIEEYEKLVEQNPASAEPFHLLAFAQQLAGKLPQARQNYEKARRLDPKSPGLDRDMGQLYTKLEENRLAREALDRALALEPREPLNYLYLGELLETQSDLRGAAGAYQIARNLAPSWDKPPQRLGVVYGKMNRLGDAYYYLGRADMLQDEDEKAIAYFTKAVKLLDADSPRAQEIKEELKKLKARK